jgi:8-oxo-dGTP pyrophosphatase MutT (NUDIX family)
VPDDIRKAASVVAVREGAGAGGTPEILVIERSRQARFLPGYVAFPGGAVDAEDRELARRWFGSPDESSRACAVRELIEEVGLVPGPRGLDRAAADAVEAFDAARMRPERLRLLARWVAPPDVPVRFDAEYFAIDAGSGGEPVPDGDEAAAAWWISPACLLEDWEAGVRRLYWPTYFTVRTIARCAAAADVLDLRFDTREPDEDELARLPRSVFWQEPGLT